jgi:hypothetical protein
MFEPSASTTEVWIERVTAWRASGERAETFSRREGYAANMLRWWASKLRHELSALPAPPEVRIARVVRTSKQPTAAPTQGTIAERQLHRPINDNYISPSILLFD